MRYSFFKTVLNALLIFMASITIFVLFFGVYLFLIFTSLIMGLIAFILEDLTLTEIIETVLNFIYLPVKAYLMIIDCLLDEYVIKHQIIFTFD